MLTKAMMNEKRMGIKWLADIEVNKVAYFGAIIALTLSTVAVHQPIIEIETYGYAASYMLNEISGIAWMKTAVIILNIVSIFCLLVPVVKFFEWKQRWFIPVILATVSELAGAMLLFAAKERIVKESVIGTLYSWLSIDLKLSNTWLTFVLLTSVALFCTAVMLKEVTSDK